MSDVDLTARLRLQSTLHPHGEALLFVIKSQLRFMVGGSLFTPCRNGKAPTLKFVSDALGVQVTGRHREVLRRVYRLLHQMA
jgi:hypothetical protein